MKKNMSIWTVVVLSVAGMCFQFAHARKHEVVAKLIRNRTAFQLARLYNKVRFGSSFSCHEIGGSVSGVQRQKGAICIKEDAFGAIQAIYDGKKTPLFLGAIPAKRRHLDSIRQHVGRKQSNDRIGVFTLNEPWECRIAGLSKLVAEDGAIVQFNYPTMDMTSPSFVDLLRAVRDLEGRDDQEIVGALVHCKAGRGRSATMVVAYLLHIIHKAGKVTTPERVEKYLILCRPQVRLGREQKRLVADFYEQLKRAKSFDALCDIYKITMQKRDLELSKA